MAFQAVYESERRMPFASSKNLKQIITLPEKIISEGRWGNDEVFLLLISTDCLALNLV